MKRILALFAAAMFTGQVWADSFTYNGLSYSVTDEANRYVKVDEQHFSSPKPSGDIVVSDKVMYNNYVYTVTSVSYSAFWNCENITSITLPNTITSIGNNAFKGCEGLTSINIPNSVTEIGTSAFQGCTSLTSILIPSSVKTMAYGVFYACNNNLTIYCEAASQPTTGWDEEWNSGNYTEVWGYTVDSDPNNFSFSGSIEDGVRSGSITKYYGTANAVIIPSSFTINGETYPVTKIGSNAFYNKTNLVSVTIPNTVTEIGSWAFDNCSKLTSVNIPNSVTTIGNYAFDDCTSLTSISIPNSVTSIGNYAFDGCSKLTKINVENDNTKYSSVDGVLFNKDTTTLIRYPAAKTGTTYTIPNSVTSIDDGAFDGCNCLTSVTIPNSVTSIGEYAFFGCSSLAEVTIPNSVTYIGSSAFSGCSSLASITIPNSVTKIGDYAFFECSGLTSVTIPNSVTTIDNYAFKSCSKLTSVTIPNSVTKIGADAFEACSKLTEINVENDNTAYSSVDGVLFNKDTTTLICYPDGKTETTYTIPNSVTEIVADAFEGCSKLTTVTIPNSVTKIFNYAFFNCHNLTSVTIPNSVTLIGYKVFYGCDNVTLNCEHKAKPNGWDDYWSPSYATVIWQELDATDPDYPELAVNVDDFTFGVTSSVEPYTAKITGYTGTNPNVVLPRKVTIDGKVHAVTELGANVFDNNKIIMAVYIPNTITTIGSKAFNENYELTIYCEANCDFETHPAGWANNWFGTNNSYFSVVGNTMVAGWYIYQIYNTSNRKLTIQRYIGHENQVTMRDTAIINGKYYYADSIAYQAFWRCDSIKELTIPKAFTKIANYAFMYCDSLKKLTYNTNAIGSTFSNHRSLKQIEIGDNVTSLANWAFGGCSDLEEVTFGESVKTVGSNAFAGCSKLKKVNLKSIKGLCSTDFDIYDSNPLEKAHHLYIDSVEVTRFAIPEGVTKIGSRAFSGGSSIDSVYIPAAVTTIGANAFAGCSALTIYCEAASQPSGWDAKWNPDKRPVVWGKTNLANMKPDSTNFNFTITNDSLCEVKVTKYYGTSGNMVIPAKTTIDGKEYTVTSIGYNAFYKNKTIIWATNPNTVTYLESYAFEYCTNLESVTISNSVTSIGNYAFEYCEKLESVTIPSSVTYIGTSPFRGATKLKEINVDDDSEYYVSIDGVLFSADKTRLIQYPCGKADTLYKVPKHVEAIDNYAINHCPYLKTLIVSNTVKNIYGDGIYSCENLERLYIPKSVTYISQYGVYGCDTVKIYCEAESKPWNWSGYWNDDNRPVVWGYDMQKFFPQLVLMAADSTSFTFRYNAENSTAEIIKYNGSSNNVVIPAKVVKDNVEYKVTGIDSACFINNDTLMQVSIPKTVRTIGAKAFAGCSELTIYCEVHSKPSSWDSKWNPNQQTVVWGAFDKDVVVNPVNTPIPANPYAGVEFDSTSFHFWIIDDSLHYVEVDRYSGTLGNIVIPSTTTINDIKYTVTNIDDGAFRDNTTIVSVVIPNSVTTIESNAFRNCKNLEYVVIPSSVTTIGEGPFCESNKLTAIYVEDGNKDFISVDGVVYSADMKTLVQYPCAKPGSTFTIPNGVENIKYGAFSSCKNLTSLILPNTLKNIYWWAISGCGHMTRLVIPKSVSYIEGNGIRNSKNLTIYCEAESEPYNWSYYWNSDGYPVVWGYSEDSNPDNFTFTFNASNYTAEVTGYTDTSKYIAIPKFVINEGEEYTVTSIGEEAFLNNKTIASVTIPSTVTTIKNKAFRHCDSLEYVLIPSSVTTIGDGPFCESNCLTAINLDSRNEHFATVDGVLYSADMKRLIQYPCLKADTLFKVPAQVVSINYGAFSGCPNLTTVVLPDTAATLKGWAVYNCDTLLRLIIPKTVTTIEDDAIRNCNNLTIYCEAESKPAGWATNWNRDSRPVVWSFSLDILDTTSNPDNFTFYTYTDGTAEVTGYNGTYSKIIIPSKFTKDGVEYTVTAIDFQAFYNNTTIVSVVIPNTVTSISSDAFRNCENLESVEIPKSVTYIGAGPFSGINKLTEIKVDSNNKDYVAVDGVLYTADMRVLIQYPSNKADTKFTVPYGVETIKSEAFNNCQNLLSLTLPSSTMEIEGWSIGDCSNLRELYIPISVTSIESDAIRSCKNLTIYCEAPYEPWGWAWDWNYDNYTVIWNTEMGSAVDESAATAVNIYAYGNTIVVENATDDVYVYNAMGGLVARTTSTTITISNTGVYIVKTGNVVKRVMINK